MSGDVTSGAGLYLVFLALGLLFWSVVFIGLIYVCVRFMGWHPLTATAHFLSI